MVQLATLAHPPRVSQSLAIITCSDCSQPLPLAELGDHLCLPSSSLQKPPMSSKPSSSFLPRGLQNIISIRAGSPAPSRTPPPHAPSKTDPDPFQRVPPTVNHNTTIPTSSSTSPPQSILLNGGTSPSTHVRFTPSSIPTPPMAIRNRTPSNSENAPKSSPLVSSFPHSSERSSPHMSASTPAIARPRTPSTRKENSPVVPQAAIPSALVPRTRTPSNAPSHNSIHPPSLTPRPSFDRTRTSSLAPRPSLDKQRPSFDAPARPSFEPQRPSFDVPRPQHPANIPRPSLDAPRPSTDRPQPISPASPLPEPVARPPRRTATVPLSSSIPFPMSAPTPHLPPAPRVSVPHGELNVDTQCGGEAGMAGVGRRGFEAAARAAMFAPPTHTRPGEGKDITLEKDGRRTNAPKYLDINATMSHVLRAAMTPPLSPNSGYSHSPVSPLPVSPLSPTPNTTSTTEQLPIAPLSSPHDKDPGHFYSPNQKLVSLSSSPTDVHFIAPSRTPSPISNPFSRHLSGETITQSPFAAIPVRLPFLDSFDKGPVNGGEDDSDEESVYTTHTAEPGRHHSGDTGPMSPSIGSEQGLAYADDSDDDTPVIMPLDVRKSSSTNKVKFPSTESGGPSSLIRSPSRNPSVSSATSYSTSRTAHGRGGPSRARSASTATHTTTRSGGALERAMETLIEEGASVSVLASGSVLASLAGPSGRGPSGKPNRSNTVPGPVSPEHKPPKLPARSHTSPHHPHIHSERVGVTGEVARIRERGKRKKDRKCVKCDQKIEDGRWIQMDGGNVLCERCWKNMYLPKCRRCDLPIEKHAVSSSDGQLKGKYHRDCFNCHTCQKPFPDKEFYVFDGKPLCAYHYHEANDSLCAAASCGQPIEGPCAVTHAGKRYHPEHLLCEFENGCGERLAEYWEVDGQMFCEKHVALAGGSSCASSRGDSPVPEERRVRDEGRARKRMTRFIDLGGDEDIDIR